MMNIEAEVQSTGAAREEISALACVDRTTGLLLSVYTAPQRGQAVVHAVVEVPRHPGLVMMGAASSGTTASLELVLGELARRIGVAQG